MKIHPAAEIFPPMNGDEYESLKASIKENGLIVPITVIEGALLDGRNRERACRELGIEPRKVEYSGGDPVEFVLAMNVSRRHLDASQRAMVAARIATLRQGARTDLSQKCEKSQSEAAQMLNIGKRTVEQARRVVTDGVPELSRAVESGRIAVSEAAKIATLDAEQQYEVITRPKAERKQIVRAEEMKDYWKKYREQKTKNELELHGQTAKTVESYYTIEAWTKLPKAERQKIIDAGFESKASMIKQDGDSIEWAKHSLNTVTGCLHDCPYCYARDIAERYFEAKFQPAFYPSRLSAPSIQKVPSESATDPSFQNVFANSMSDLFGKWVPADWIEATIEMARRNQKWNFLVLTKFPQRAADFEFPDNWWMGTTVDAQARVVNAEKAFEKIRCKTKWISCEPLLEPLRFNRIDLFQWVVIGGASRSNRTPEWIPPYDWIADLHMQARACDCRIYHKSNTGLFDMRVKEFPWVEPKSKTLPASFRYLKGMK